MLPYSRGDCLNVRLHSKGFEGLFSVTPPAPTYTLPSFTFSTPTTSTGSPPSGSTTRHTSSSP